MNPDIIQKLIISIVVLFLTIVCFQFFKFYALKTQKKLKLQDTRYFAIKRFTVFLSAGLFFVLLMLVWGINLKNLWVSITGILAMIAIAFFAIWSLIGNITAGLIIFFTSPFKVNDTIEVTPDGKKGKVLAINTFYTLLIDDEGNHINVPNSLFFQKFIIKFSNSGHKDLLADNGEINGDHGEDG